MQTTVTFTDANSSTKKIFQYGAVSRFHDGGIFKITDSRTDGWKQFSSCPRRFAP